MRILLAKAAHITSTQIAIVPPLGLLYLAGSLRELRPWHDVRLIDLRVKPESLYREILTDWQPDVVGIGALTVESDHAHALAADAARLAPSAHVVLGGPHPTAYPTEVLADPNVDSIVIREGEETFVELIDALAQGADLDAITGLALRDDEGCVFTTPARPFIDDLDALPGPAWEMLNFRDYEKAKSMGLVGARRVAPIFTSRACPYRCTYCHDMFGKRVQMRSPQHVLDELQMLSEQRRVRHFELIDDIFNLDRERTRRILQGIIDRGLDVRLSFPNGLRADLLTEELVDLFARAGTEFVSIAIETASPRLQKYIKKHVQLDKARDVIRWFVERRVFTNCFYMLGFPTETVDEMNATIRFAVAQPSHTAMFFIVTPFAGTELVDQVGEAGMDELPGGFEAFAYHESNINVSGEIPTDVLHRAVKRAYLRFLANPTRLTRLVADHPNKLYLAGMGRLLLDRLLFDNLNQEHAVDRLRDRLAAWSA